MLKTALIINTLIVMKEVLTPVEIIRNLGERFRDFRMRRDMTQQQVSDLTTISIPTIYKFETGRMTDMSLVTLLKLLRVIGLDGNWNELIPDLPESPYLYKENKKRQRIRHPKK